jgi:hypothetical protein
MQDDFSAALRAKLEGAFLKPLLDSPVLGVRVIPLLSASVGIYLPVTELVQEAIRQGKLFLFPLLNVSPSIDICRPNPMARDGN